MKKKGAISRREYVALTNISLRQTNKDLNDLLLKKVIVKSGRGRNVRCNARLVHDSKIGTTATHLSKEAKRRIDKWIVGFAEKRTVKTKKVIVRS